MTDSCPSVVCINCEPIIDQSENNDILNLEVNEMSLIKPHELCDTAIDLSRQCNIAVRKCASSDITDSQQQSDSRNCLDQLDANFKFDMAKIANDVKIRIRKRKDMQIRNTSQFEYKSFCLNSLFGEESLCCEEEIKEKKGQIKITKNDPSSDQSHSDLFEETKTKKKRNKKRPSKVEKSKNTENESFGLEWLFNENKSKKCRRKRKIQENNHKDDEAGKELVKKNKPNYFVAIRVSNPQIHVAVKDFQACILKENEELEPAFIPLPSLHLTMAVMFLDETLTEVAKNALEKCTTKIKDILKCIDFKLHVSGVENFRREVVFAKIKELESLQAINHVITTVFEDEGITILDNKNNEWKAHLTLLKLSRKPSLKRKGIKKIKEEIYVSWNESHFGEEQVTNMFLCSMFEPKEKDGFYKCTSTISLSGANDEEINTPQHELICNT